MRERFVILGLAPPRAAWFRTVSGWASAAVLPAEFVRCVSLEDLRARLRSGRAFSTVLVDGRLPGLDRDLIAEARSRDVAVLVVDPPDPSRWRELGAAATLAAVFSRDEFVEVLSATSAMVGTATLELSEDTVPVAELSGTWIAVCGTGGTGASSVAIALAQGLAADAGGTGDVAGSAVAGDVGDVAGSAPRSHLGGVLLADLCRYADQALLHDARVLVPSVQEVVEAHRTTVPELSAVADQLFDVPARGYRLLLGLRRPRHWVLLRPLALDRALDSLQALAEVVVADIEADVEGEAETGSVDVEDRNLLARAALARADLVVFVAEASMKGVYATARYLDELLAFGVPADRIVPVLNRSPRSPRRRAELTATLAELVRGRAGAAAAELTNPLHLPDRPVESALRDGSALPGALSRSLARVVSARLAEVGTAGRSTAAPEPVAVQPGSLGDLDDMEGAGS